MFAIMAFFFVIYLLATEYISLQKSKGDVLLFRKQNMLKAKMADVEEAKTALGPETSSVVKASRSSHPPSQTSLDENSGEATFLWEGLSYEVPVKDGNKKILNDIEGWIRPGTLTALIVRRLCTEKRQTSRQLVLTWSRGRLARAKLRFSTF